MFSQTLHHLVVGLTTGIATLACLCAIAAWVSNYFVGAKDARSHLDTASYIAAIAALPLLPIAVLYFLSQFFQVLWRCLIQLAMQ